MALEPSREIHLTGVHAYAEKSVFAGDTLHFRVSSSVPYRISVVRLGTNPDGTSEDVELLPAQDGGPNQQPIRPGSYVNVDTGLPDKPFKALTLECWVRPWDLDSWQGVLTQHRFPDASGIGLFLTPAGYVLLYFGQGTDFDGSRLVRSPRPLTRFHWHHLVGVWDGSQVSLWIDGQRVAGPFPLTGPVRPGTAPLRLGAYGEVIDGQPRTCKFLNGDLAMPVIYDRALSAGEIQQRYADKGLHPPPLKGVLACWPLSEEKGSEVADISGNKRHGHIINEGTWMIGGPGFDGANGSRFKKGYNPAKDATRGHALRLASDDLYDCYWQESHAFALPPDLTPGIYVGRVRHGDAFQHIYDVTFVVRRARGLPKAPILVLCATNTWLAYCGTPFAPNHTGNDPRQFWGVTGQEDPSEAPKYNFYSNHRTEQPTYKMGLNLPWPAASPYTYYSSANTCYSHLSRAERFTHLWLESNGYDFDVATDFDLHQNPELLKGYQVVLINGHSEYWSIPAYKGVESYLKQGGKVIALSGNTMFWRVSFDGKLTTMECRKAERLGAAGGLSHAIPGELYHSNDGLLGSLMRESGHSCWRLLGLESVGYINNDNYLAFTCDKPEHPFFEGTELVQGAKFASDAVGHEWDVRIDLPQQRINGLIPKQDLPKGVVTLAHCQATRDEAETKGDTLWDYSGQELSAESKQQIQQLLNSQMIYWKRPAGGEVFFAGAIGTGWALMKSGADPRWGVILRNVFQHFGVRPAATPIVEEHEPAPAHV
ncbi:LamG domain-containing protein [Archangium lipolyticum]|uniref:LamG domain-containing protein n=1 Tax=Archangium lipolyticum TaxID=2970465 RepID=UPI00214A01C1|nr:LamG domain-containing protein [Archangium lipolyticum]